MAGKKTVNKKKSSKTEYTLKDEVISIALMAVTVFLFLCNFGVGGVLGHFFSGVMFGLFGLRAYVAPILIAFEALFFISNAGNSRAVRKIASAYALFFMLGMLIDLFSGAAGRGAELISPIEIWKEGFDEKGGAGILAALIVRIMYRFMSLTGTVLLLAVLVIICLVILTDKSFIRGVKDGSHSVMEHAGEDYSELRKRRLEQREIKMERRRQEREEAAVRREELRARREEEEALLKEERREERAREEERARQKKNEKELEKQRREDEKVLRRVDRIKTGVTDNTTLCPDVHETDEVVHEEDSVSAIPKTAGGDDIHEITYGGMKASAVGDEMTKLTGMETETDGLIRRTSAVSSALAREMVSGRRSDLSEEQATESVAPEEPIQESVQESLKASDITEAVVDETTSEEVQTFNQSVHSETESVREEVKSGISRVAQVSSAAANKVPQADASQAKEKEEHGDLKNAPKTYQFPPLSLLNKPEKKNGDSGASQMKETAAKLEKVLKTFGVNAKVVDFSKGPTVTRYELQPEIGVKVSRILNLSDDIKMNLAATDIRIEAPIPGKVAVGIEVPNTENVTVMLRELLEDKVYQEAKSALTFAVGKDIAGATVVTDIAKMPHLLIAGATGSGKSVCINTMILSLLYKSDPRDVKLVMIDPKVVELSIYNGIPHLLIPVVTDSKKAAGALNWAVGEMEKRYQLFAEAEVRDLAGYNKYVELDDADGDRKKLPQIVVIVDELADLMMVAKNDVETAICRLAQKARAAGIHLIIATQRPSVDVITGLIKANVPSRIAFAVSSGTDSRTILDMNGAEKLLGKGDMLFFPQSYSKPVRVQGAFVSDHEIQGICDFLKKQNIAAVDEQAMKQVEASAVIKGDKEADSSADSGYAYDELFEDVGRYLIENQEKTKASIGSLQRKYRIGFNRAARIMDQLCEAGVVGDAEGTKPRPILMSMTQFEQMLDGEGEATDEVS